MKRLLILFLSPWLVACGGGDTLSTVSETCTDIDPGSAYSLPDTGQYLCYDQTGDQITCPASGEDAYGQDAQYGTSHEDFTYCYHDQVAYDNRTGLFWPRGFSQVKSYADASSDCDSKDFAGFSDWRLPNVKELMTLVDYMGSVDATSAAAPSNPYIFGGLAFGYDLNLDTTGDETAQAMGQSWTTTTRPDQTSYRYMVNFLTGELTSDATTDATTDGFYRCVRGTEQSTEVSYTDNADLTVTDATADLMWQQVSDSTRYDWEAALAYCEALELAGYIDWRLPNIKELQRLVDYSDSSVALDTASFGYSHTSGTQPYYWSSTTDLETPGHAFYVCFGSCPNADATADVYGPGAVRSGPKFDDGDLPDSVGLYQDAVQVENYVRCVRDAE